MEYPKFNQDCQSLVSKYLTKDIFDQLKDKKTAHGFSLTQAINSGIQNPDSSIGIYAGDQASYSVFKLLFDPIIESYHKFSKEQNHSSNLNPENLPSEGPDPENKYIISTRIRVGRNLNNIPLGTAISKTERKEVKEKVVSALSFLSNELAGNYYNIQEMSPENRLLLTKSHFLFKEGDRFFEAAGLNRHWPKDRGIYYNTDKTFLVWINEEDHLRIISMEKGDDIKGVFKRLTLGLAALEKSLDFAFSQHLGYITSCPTNLGTALRASVHIKLPKLGQNMTLFKEMADAYHLQIRGIDGEHSKSIDSVYDISNKRRLGVTEVQCVQDMYNGVVALIQKEKEL